MLQLVHALAEEPESFGGGGTSPQTTPPVVMAPSQGKTVVTLPPSADPDMHMAQDPDDDNIRDNVDNNINDHGYDDEFFMPPFQEPKLSKDARDPSGPAEKPNCNMRLFSSQETPPAAAFTETQTAQVQNIISPKHSVRRPMSR
jgi:hypothetical protein